MERSETEKIQLRRATLSGGRRGGFCPLAICNRSKPTRIDRGYANPIVVDKDVPEDDTFHLFPRQLVCRNSIDLFFLQGREKALHTCVVKAVSRAAEALLQSGVLQRIPESFAGVLAAAVAVEDCSLELLTVLRHQLLYGTDAQFLFHVAVIAMERISPLKQSSTAETYSFPS